MKYPIEALHYQDQHIIKKQPKKIVSSTNRIAIIIHIYYPDLWEEIALSLSKITQGYDLFVTVPPHITDIELLPLFESQPNIHLYMTENRGRDVLPFLQIMKLIGTENYDYICKLHSKKTEGSQLGKVWRKLLYFDLIGSNKTVENILELFTNDAEIGMVTGKNTILDSQRYTYGNRKKIDFLAQKTGMLYDEYYLFPAGTMFWTKTEVLKPIMMLFNAGELIFEEEQGQKDDTLAHAIERFFGITCQAKKLTIIESPSLYSELSDHTLNEVASLVLSQQYVGNNVFAMQKQKIEEQNRYIDYLEELAESMRMKNRLKSLLSDKIIPLGKKIAKIPTKLLKIVKVVKDNPTLLKKVFYYAKRGELKYLITKIREKSSNNLSAADRLVAVTASEYFGTFDEEKYRIKDLTIDIIIPVYNGYAFLAPLFDSLEKNTLSSYRLIVINDCSPDEKVKPYLLKRLQKHPTAIFIDHEENQGFLKSVNEAYTHTQNHFVLLNTDTEVPEFWLERLMYPILQMEKVASTTPFTNSGEIASFPNFVADNEIFDGMEVDALDKCFSVVNPTYFYAQVPTGVGFCMGVNHTLAKEIGMFAEDTFGKGYGEENDWCQRAIKQGYRNLIVPNLFVYHKHGGSFSAEEKQALLQKNAVTLLERHPNYSKDVTEYIQADPHHTLRHLLVLTAADQQVGTHLIFDHDLGGGANVYSNELVEKYQEEKKNVLCIKYDYYSRTYKLLHRYKTFHFDFKIESFEEVQVFIERLDIREIFLNNFVSFPESYTVLEYIETVAEKTEAELIIPIHDFYAICPSYTLLNEEGKYCHVPSLETCKICMTKNMQEWRNYYQEEIDMPKWRALWLSLLKQSDTILSFSNSSKEILLKAYPELDQEKVTLLPHQTKPLAPVSLSTKEHTTLTIGILGAIDYIKGSHIVKQMVQLIEKNDLDINVVVIGEITEPIRSKHFQVTGRYQREKLPSIIEEHHVDIFLIPSIWPETFSYTTQEIMMMELPLMVFNLGAPAERVSKYEKGYVIDEISAQSVLDSVKEVVSSYK